MGAHVWGPAFLRDELLPSFQLRGWSPDWYAGFPAMQFYMVVPYLLIVLLDLVLPYGVAFKLVAVSGVVSMPASAWAMGRLARWPFPLPPLLAVAGLLFVFDFNFTIYGGNIASTLAGEFAFSISLSVALVYLGLVMRTLDSGRGAGWAAIALAMVALCHPIPLIFAVGATAVIVAARGLHRLPSLLGPGSAALAIVSGLIGITIIWRMSEHPAPRLAVIGILVAGLLLTEARRAAAVIGIGLVGGLLSAFWTVPFLARRPYLNDMGWEKLHEVRENLFFPDELGGDGARLSILWLLGLAGLAAFTGLVRWHRTAVTFTAIAVAAMLGFIHWPQHRLWNARLLPFWYLSLYLLAAIGVYFLATRLMGGSDETVEPESPRSRGVRLAAPPVALVVAVLFVGLYLGANPGGAYDDSGVYRWGPVSMSSGERNFVSGWAEWNFSGIEARSGYPTYYDLMTTMTEVGATYGCGRALWEYDRDEIGRYGTPMAPMLLPHWTDGCIGSMEGLYFESSPTVPFHFLMQSELSANPSRPMRGLPYNGLDLDLGVPHLQMSGVRYYVAFSTEALAAASRHSDVLEPIAFADPWTVYLVRDSALVSPLPYEPVVVRHAPVAGRSWTDPAVTWFNDPTRWNVPVAADGPADWARVDLVGDRLDEEGSLVLDEFEAGPVRALPEVQVFDIVDEGDRVTFSVDRTGVPVLVKVSYFPNWAVDGAAGPYRVTPNWMIVIPNQEEVTLTYGASGVEYAAWGLTLLGLVVLGATWRRPLVLDPPALSSFLPDGDGPADEGHLVSDGAAPAPETPDAAREDLAGP